MLNIIIFGAPGSGKGTQSERIAEKYQLTHISTGDVLRNEIAKQTELGKLADSYMSKGNLVPDQVVINVLNEFLTNNADKAGFIFDGFPRTLPQGEAMDAMLEANNERIDVVLWLDVEDDELIDRLLKRGKDSGREDDTFDTIKARLKVYYNETAPLQDFYTKQDKLVQIKGTGTVDDIFSRIVAAIDNLKG